MIVALGTVIVLMICGLVYGISETFWDKLMKDKEKDYILVKYKKPIIITLLICAWSIFATIVDKFILGL